ncbi:MAG: hypothetical protein F6K22_16145 [Okeania sp. SIO2F4]|nr:hypothetical protein [Okeania sp. SIO2F4]
MFYVFCEAKDGIRGGQRHVTGVQRWAREFGEMGGWGDGGMGRWGDGEMGSVEEIKKYISSPLPCRTT